ncbi:hypothetical protein Rs2_02914 [Raphanus sativus]|nr:hypothetical protein Rs2_02914 [Raphanus sativus]
MGGLPNGCPCPNGFQNLGKEIHRFQLVHLVDTPILWRFCLRSIDSGRLSVLYISPVVSRLRALPFSSGCLSTSLRSPRLHVSPVVSRLSSPDSPLLKQAAPSSQFPHSLSFTVFKATRDGFMRFEMGFVCDPDEQEIDVELEAKEK